MENPNIYDDLKQGIEIHFSFLKEFGFPDFEERQLAYEWHFETNNDVVKIDIWFEATFSTPVWAKINQYYIDALEPQNSVIKQYIQQLKENYDEPFDLYLKTKETAYLQKIAEQYAINGHMINNNYLQELGEMLKRHISVLHGDMELLKANTGLQQEEQEQQAASNRIQKQIYTLEYCFISDGLDGNYDAYEEFTNLHDLKQYLAQNSEIKIYRILDWNMNPVN